MEHCLVHSGQHYDELLSGNFFADLGLPKPDVNLEVGSGSHAVQTAEIMKGIEPVLLDYKPQMVLVVGDVNSTIAAALTAVKLGIGVAHIEAGLRSFDMTMPEEINRKLTDAVSSLLFVTEQSGVENLKHEGVPAEKIFLVGNVMIDSLLRHREMAARSPILDRLGMRQNGSGCRPYGVLTLHRPSNVDDPETLARDSSRSECAGRRVSGLLPHSSSNQEKYREFRFAAISGQRGRAKRRWNRRSRSTRIPRLHFAQRPGAHCPHRFRRSPGRNHSPRRALPYAAGEHRAAGNGSAGIESGSGSGFGSHSCSSKIGSRKTRGPVRASSALGRQSGPKDRCDPARAPSVRRSCLSLSDTSTGQAVAYCNADCDACTAHPPVPPVQAWLASVEK